MVAPLIPFERRIFPAASDVPRSRFLFAANDATIGREL
jgi:hypothetical protein